MTCLCTQLPDTHPDSEAMDNGDGKEQRSGDKESPFLRGETHIEMREPRSNESKAESNANQ